MGAPIMLSQVSFWMPLQDSLCIHQWKMLRKLLFVFTDFLCRLTGVKPTCWEKPHFCLKMVIELPVLTYKYTCASVMLLFTNLVSQYNFCQIISSYIDFKTWWLTYFQNDDCTESFVCYQVLHIIRYGKSLPASFYCVNCNCF